MFDDHVVMKDTGNKNHYQENKHLFKVGKITLEQRPSESYFVDFGKFLFTGIDTVWIPF